MNCIIIEDQLPAQRIIKKYLAQMPAMKLIQSFQNAIDASEFLRAHSADLIFLDINLPKISGINFLKNLPNPPNVIITSAYAQYALEGFELDVVDYLLKPFSFERFHKAVSKVPATTNEPSNDFIFIRCDKEFFKVKSSEIQYIKGDDDFTRVHTKRKMFLDNRAMKTWISELPSSFIRIHRSYILNLEYITRISGQRVFIDNMEFPIGRSHKQRVMEMIESKSGKE